MKKLLLAGVAAVAVSAAAPASAEIELNLGGYFKGYGAFVDQDENNTTTVSATGGTASVRDFDLLRNTEIHFGGETTLDNGLTVGAHVEVESDSADGFEVEESYVYFSGGWGRVNLGAENGAAYLLQVAAPSADSNIDGLRQLIQPFNYDALTGNASVVNAVSANGLDYENNMTGYTDKLTYLTPVFSGFQAGVSYTVDNDDSAASGVGFEDDATDGFEEAYEIAARYEGQYENVGVTLGAGYANQSYEGNTAGIDDRTQWNVAADLDFAGFGFGVAYTEDDYGNDGAASTDDEETLVVGADYTTGAFKFGVSYFDQDNTFGIEDLETKRYTGGVVYTYGPGMTFRGSISQVEHENAVDAEGTAVLLGTDIKF
tara:strand:- start:274 stop:1392 length:1119 start_codon:yes stop_codon:yes gene_type:complete